MQKVPLSGLEEFAKQVLIGLSPKSKEATLVVLQGTLGAGKTTFVQALAKALGVDEVVQSPTYVLMKSYPINTQGFERLVHIDAYRLNDPQEFATLKPEEFLHSPTSLIVFEWPERVGALLPAPDCVIRFSSEGAGEGDRFIQVEESLPSGRMRT